MKFNAAVVFVSFAFLVVAASSDEVTKDQEVNQDGDRTGGALKPLIGPMIAASLMKPLVKPLFKPALVAAAAGAVGSTMARPVTISIETSDDQTRTVVFGCGSLNGNPCYGLPSGCYCPVPVQKPWAEAFSICRSAGKKLLSIESASKQIEMQLYLPQILASSSIYSQIGLWTSGAYCVTSFTWTARPEYFTYTNWVNGEPTVTGFTNGACVRAVPTNSFKWDDIDCGQYLPFVCEP